MAAASREGNSRVRNLRGASLLLVLISVFVVAAAGAPSVFGTVIRRQCIWRADTETCTWNLLYPFTEIGNLQTADALEGSNTKARSLLEAAVRLEYCSTVQRAGGGADACNSAALLASSSPAAEDDDGVSPPAAAACEWRQTLPEATSSLLRKLLSGSDNDDTAAPSCVPPDLDVLLAPYLELIAPERCGDATTAEDCRQLDPRCTFVDHDGDARCIVDYLYGAKLLAVSEDAAVMAPLPQAALTAQHECLPESFWLHGNQDRPPALVEEECGWRGSAGLDLDSLFRLAAQAGLPVPPITRSFEGDASSPARSPPPSTLPDVPVVGVSEAAPSSPDAATPSSSSAPPPPPSPPSQSVSPDVAVSSDPPACELDSRSRCVPTLLNFATAAVAAVPGSSAGTGTGTAAGSPFKDMPAVARPAMAAAHDAVHCILAASSAASPGPAASASATPSALQPMQVVQHSDAATVGACVAAALAARPDAGRALGELFSPPCGQLTSQQCESRVGCVLEQHGDHHDCVRGASYAADHLLQQLRQQAVAAATADDPAAAVVRAVAGEAQRLADTCRVISRSSCIQLQLTNLTLSRSRSLPILAAAAGMEAVALSPEAEAGSSRDVAGSGGGAAGGGGGEAQATPGGGSGPLQQQQQGRPEDLSDDDHGGHDDHGDEGNAASKKLRIGAVFVVLVAGLVGCLIPVLLRDLLTRHPLLTAVLRAMCAGLLLALALVHVAAHASEELNSLLEKAPESASAGGDAHDHRRLRLHRRMMLQAGGAAEAKAQADTDADYTAHDYHADEGAAHDDHAAHEHPFPLGMCTVLFGYLLMVAVEHVTHALVERYGKAVPQGGSGAVAAEPDFKGAGSLSPVPPVNVNNCDMHRPVPLATPAAAAAPPPPQPAAAVMGSPLPCCKPYNPGAADASGAPMTSSPSNSLEAFRLAGMAAVFELGCVFHSFLIGLSLGTTSDYGTVVALTCALAFHQMLEGIGLGTVLVSAQLGVRRLASMVALYAVTCPVGIAVGIGIADSYEVHSVTARAVQGTLNGVSAGLLLYLAAAMVACDFGIGAVARWRPWERLLLLSVMFAGAALFAMLAVWA